MGEADHAERIGSTRLIVPRADARRIAAECYGARSYVPGWLPPGFAFSHWSVGSHNDVCDLGPVLHFRRGAADLTWREFDPGLDPQVPCRARRFAARILNGRAVFFMTARGLDVAWTCIRGAWFPKTIVSQRVGARGRAAPVELERMVASAHTLPPGRARGSRYELAPRREVSRIAAAFGEPFYVPATLPAGFIFIQWKVVPNDPDTNGRRSLFVTFGRDGPVIEWGVYARAVTLDCPGKHSRFPANPSLLIDGHRVFYVVGIHGGGVWRCIPPHVVGNSKPLEVELWFDIRVDSAAMERQVAKIVADAKLVRVR